MKYQFCMTIGDWSGDGHGQYKDYLVQSNAPVEKVREAHFAMKDVLGISVEDICSEYGEDNVDANVVIELKNLGFEFENNMGVGEEILVPDDMIQLWLFLLRKTDPTLKLELEIVKEDVPTLHFYGYDDKKRHIGFIGYGLF